MMKIGVIPDSFQVPFKEAVALARGMGVRPETGDLPGAFIKWLVE